MSKRYLKCLLVCGAGYMPWVYAVDSPHVVSKQHNQIACTVCHINTPELKDTNILISKNLPVDLTHFSLDGVAMCAPCHSTDAYHKIGLNVDFAVPADLPLNQNNEMICLTCHYVHGRLNSDKPQASYSVMDRLMNAERLRKSFLLRRNNSDGELCLTCHDLSQGAKE